MRTALKVRLKTADATSLTALETLRHEMGYGDTLKSLTRVWAWLFDLHCGAEEGARILEKIVRESNLFVNPNKHHYRIEAEGVRPNMGTPFSAWVALVEPGTGTRELARIRTGYGLPAVRGLFGCLLWRLEFAERTADAGRLADEIAIVRSRARGLLVNPHAAEARVYEEEPGVAELLELSAGGPR